MPDFDPYYKWLAIPPSEQPPNHYRLLGVVAFESDLDVIAAASDRQMAHVRSYQNGPHGADSQRLLNELSHARLTLLRPESKSRYDDWLRHQVARQHPAHEVQPGASSPITQPLPGNSQDPGWVLPQQVQPLQPARSGQPTTGAQPIPVRSAVPSAGANINGPVLGPVSGTAATGIEKNRDLFVSDGRPIENQRARKRKQTLMSAAGVVGGGVVGCYLAGIILNALGADLPSAVRFLPGLGAKSEVAENVSVDQAASASSQSTPTNTASSNTAPITYTTDPWGGRPSSGQPIVLGQGRHQVQWNCNVNPPRLQLGTGAAVGRFPIETYALRSPGVVASSEVGMSFFATQPGQAGYLGFHFRAAPGFEFQGPQALSRYVSRSHENCGVKTIVASNFDNRTYRFPDKSVLQEFIAPLGTSQETLRFTLAGVSELWIVTCIDTPHNFRSEEARVSFDNFSAQLHVAPVSPLAGRSPTVQPPPPASSPSSGAGPVPSPTIDVATSRLELRPHEALAVQTQARPQDPERALANARAAFTSDDPRAWIEKSMLSQTPEEIYALLTIAGEKAVEQGDVILAAAAFDRLRRSFQDDFTSEEIQALSRLYQQNQAGFQPVAFANWSLDVLERVAAQGALSQQRELLTMAAQTVHESGDNDLRLRLGVLVANQSQNSASPP